ncbi:MAG TPA: ABC transporter ATP-binding protein [Candidatus Hydrogenedentes bacterium]|nr:ABC transporter ATP-binding protein [Candidatus Hydrogenedentota bacterium]
MSAIVTRELGKVYRAVGRTQMRALEAVDLNVREGEVYGFLGRNGAGKTTTIKILCSLLRPTSGEAFVLGENARTRKARGLIGYLPEQPYFYEYLTPRETIDFYARLQGLDAAARAREWEKLAGMLDLRGIADQRVKGFSKGMRQRLGFAVALVGDPPILILDEPMSGLDPLGRRSIRELILWMRDAKKTLFFSSHVLGDVEQICDRVGILVRGRLTHEGRLDELLGEQVKQVEIIVAGLSPEAARPLAARAVSHRTLDELDAFLVDGQDAANDLVRAVHGAGGRLVEFSPVRKSLEDYFIEAQEKDKAS